MTTNSAIAWARYGRHASLAGEHSLALFALENAVELGADDAPVWIALGIARANERHTEGAIEAFEKAVARDPKAIDAWCMLGELAVEMHRYALAAEAFRRCAALDPDAATPHGARARALVRKTYKALQAQLG